MNKLNLDVYEREKQLQDWGKDGWAQANKVAPNTTGLYLRARTALTTGKPKIIRQVLELIEERKETLLVAMKAILAAQLGEPNYVISLQLPSEEIAVQDNYDAIFWKAFAQGIASADLGYHADALVNYGIAIATAMYLSLPDRIQLVEMHKQAVENQLGIARPEEILETLRQPMSESRKRWSEEGYVLSLLSRGLYKQAYDSAEDGSYWKSLTGVLIGYEPLEGDTSHYDVAEAWHCLLQGETVKPLPHLRGGILSTYGRLAASAALASRPETARMALVGIGDCPERPDQAALWSVIILQAMSQGVYPEEVFEVFEAFSAALESLENAGEVVALMTKIAPEGTLLGCMAPTTHLSLAQVYVPLVKRSYSITPEELALGLKGEAMPKGCVAIFLALNYIKESAIDKPVLFQWWKDASSVYASQMPQHLVETLDAIEEPEILKPAPSGNLMA